jgi:DNA repair protein RecO (recombination protein O)
MVYQNEPVAAYVLHTRPYRETSALVDFLTLEYGKVSAVVKGVRRPGSKLRAVIQPFVPLQIRWRGRQDLKSLISAEAVGHNGILQGDSLMCGLYVNELLQRLLVPFDSVPRLYVFYQYVITALVQQKDVEGALRTFERQILQETGYSWDYSGLEPNQVYRFELDDWCFQPVKNLTEVERIRYFTGKDLLYIEDDAYEHPSARKAAKRLMRLAIDHLTKDKPLQSRSLFLKRS